MKVIEVGEVNRDLVIESTDDVHPLEEIEMSIISSRLCSLDIQYQW